MIRNKYGEEAEIVSEVKEGRKTVITIVTKNNEILEISKVSMTKGTWQGTKAKTKRLKEEKTKKRKEKNKDINIKVKKELIPFTNILGLDQSTTGTGYSIIKATGEVIKIEEINSDEEDFIKRSMETIEILKKEIAENIIKIIAIENIYLEVPRFRNAIMNKVKSYEQLSYLKNRIIELSYEMAIEIMVIYASSWKAHYGLTKNKKDREKQKEGSIEIVEKLIGMKVSDNKADSVLIAKYVIEKRIEII